MGVPLINVLYQKGDPGTIGVLSTPLLLYHVEQLILGNIEVEILKKWVARGNQVQENESSMNDDSSNSSSDSDQRQTTTLPARGGERDEESAFDSGVTRMEGAVHHYSLKKI